MITEYEVTAPMGVTFDRGTVMLSEKQAARRIGCLKNLGEGTFEIIKTTTFKCGEIIGYDGKAPKALMSQIVEVEETAPEGTGAEDEGIALDEMTKKELAALAKDQKIEIPTKATKEEMIKIILSNQETESDEEVQ